MINKLILLADALDLLSHKNIATKIDNLIKSASYPEQWEEITKVDEDKPLPPLEAVEPELLEDTSLSAMELVDQIRVIFSRMPNPTKWNDEQKQKIYSLLTRLTGLL